VSTEGPAASRARPASWPARPGQRCSGCCATAIAYALPVAASDAFFVAFTIPNCCAGWWAGPLTVAFVPVFSQALAFATRRAVLRATWTLALLVTS
jgi:peptidoglycan biosynthesis protein MviN/MurJ (putative lipid II flippase)